MHLDEIYQTVSADFEEVNQLINAQLNSRVPLVENIAQYIVESGGKRMRPLLVLLSARALGYQGIQHIKLATIIEFLHTATLLHDDVVDTSELRRGKSTANAQWGNAPSVLVGDFLYSRAFQMMVEIGEMPIMDILANATNIIAEGEVFQLMNAKNPDVSEKNYFSVIESKTAMLFEAASHTGAMLASNDREKQTALKVYGLQLGLAFQLIDDVLDYEGDTTIMGKNIGDDLAEGKPTLPLIHAMQHANERDRKIIRQAIRQGNVAAIDKISEIVLKSGALDYTKRRAIECSEKAILALAKFEPSSHLDALKALAHLSVHRNK
jgi:octaprenyl-diphosphate synthase